MLLTLLLLGCIALIIVLTVRLHLHPFLALLGAAITYGLCSGMAPATVVTSISDGFGNTLNKIGIVIIGGVIIGTFLERSGGAYAVTEKILRLVGQRHISLAMAMIGYIVSVPVFGDSGFVILSPLNKALAKRARISLAGPAIALALGLTVTHCLVPPTPGPIAAAGILGADIGLVILFGLVVSLFAVFVGWLFAVRIASRVQIDPDPELSATDVEERLRQAPSAVKAVIPMILPIGLIVLKSISDIPAHPLGDGLARHIVGFLGDPILAILIGVLFAFWLPANLQRSMLSTSGWVGDAIRDSANIIVITGAGGSFGAVLRNSAVANILSQSIGQAHLGIFLPFLIAAAIKTAQGSSTVALVTTASFMTPLISSMGFDSAVSKALLVTAISAGAMVVSHANDSFFWVVTQMSRMDVKTGYKLHTVGTAIIGLTSILIVWVLSLLFC
jgi:GntP family gluconate:H+ symporter